MSSLISDAIIYEDNLDVTSDYGQIRSRMKGILHAMLSIHDIPIIIRIIHVLSCLHYLECQFQLG